MKQEIRQQITAGARKIDKLLTAAEGGQVPRGDGPEFAPGRIHYEITECSQAISCGGIGAIHQLAAKVGLIEALDTRLPILKRRRPYSESDHILNIVYNTMGGGLVLEDLELRRNDLAYLAALGTRMIPDPTTAGDFCRRFGSEDNERLMTIPNDIRVKLWKAQPAAFFEETARIDGDGSLVATTGECKQGMDISYNGIWGYHPLVISLANTGEPLFILNRSGNRPSHEGAPAYYTRAIELCRNAGWKDVLLRGDTDFSQTAYFDQWNDAGVRFVFGYDASPAMTGRAEAIDDSEYRELERQSSSRCGHEMWSSKRSGRQRASPGSVSFRGDARQKPPDRGVFRPIRCG